MSTNFIAAALLLIPLASFAQNAPAISVTFPPVSPPTLADATGKVVGFYQAPAFGVFRFNGAVIVIGIGREGQSTSKHSSKLVYREQDAYFASLDCSGVPIPVSFSYINEGKDLHEIHGGRAVAYARSAVGRMTAFIASSSPPTERDVGSVRNSNGTCSLQPGVLPGYDVESVVLMPAEPLTVQ